MPSLSILCESLIGNKPLPRGQQFDIGTRGNEALACL
jgi:hypothetical protein